MELNLHSVLGYLTFWRIVTTIIIFFTIRSVLSYLKVWLYLQEMKTKHGAKTVFQFPIGYPYRVHNDPDSMDFSKDYVKENPKGRLLATHVGLTKEIFLVDPVLVKDFLTNQSRYKKSKVFQLFEDTIGKGLVFSNGSVWKKHRKVISETFRFDFIASQISRISAVAKDLFEKELTEVKGKNVNILDLYQRITGELVFQIFFGEDLQRADIEGMNTTKYLARLVNLMNNNVLSPENILFGIPGIKLRLFKRNRDLFPALKEFNRFGTSIIENRKKKFLSGTDAASTASKDFLNILLETQKMSAGTEDEFTDEEILHEFITFFIAGMDTTGHLLTMATYYYYHSSEEVKQKLKEEAEFLVNSGEITPEKLNKVETLTAFLKETLRMAGPTPLIFDREAIEDHYIGDIRVSKGTMVNCSFAGNNFNPEYYKEPEKFNLNRWISDHSEYEAGTNKNPYIFTPFSAGSRNCIGQHLAMMEAKIIFSIFITNFKFKIPDNYKLRMKMEFLYEPRDTLHLDVENCDGKARDSFKCK